MDMYEVVFRVLGAEQAKFSDVVKDIEKQLTEAFGVDDSEPAKANAVIVSVTNEGPID
jgi:hypothetical protein